MACVYDCICYVFVYVCVHYVCMMFVLMCTCKIICKVVVAAPIVNNGEQTRHDKASSGSGKTRTEAAKRDRRRQNENRGGKMRPRAAKRG